jgi:glutamate formiminotransferase
VRSLVAAVEACDATVLDVHSDAVHHRSVLTVAGEEPSIVHAMASLAAAARAIDLRHHRGAHPRLGGLDVCPIVAYGIALERAAAIAWATGRAIASVARLPVYLYGAAATRPAAGELPGLRRGGMEGLIARAAAGLEPDLGPRAIDPSTGVVCVGARDVLIAFNVWLACDAPIARDIARAVRSGGGGLPRVRAMGLAMSPGVSQVSMNLVDPATTGVDAAFEAVAREARARRVQVRASEVVGLVPERYAPDPNKEAARLLMKPGRTLEAALRELG